MVHLRRESALKAGVAARMSHVESIAELIRERREFAFQQPRP